MKLTDFTHPAYFLINPQGAIVTQRSHGIDISKYDLHYLPETAMGQLDFVVQRTSYRKTKDEAFDTMLPGVLATPIRLAYHYYNYGYSGDGTWQEQVNVMLSVMNGLPFHGTFWDLEESYNVMGNQIVINSYYAIQELQQRTGMPSGLYTSLNVWNTYVYPTIKSHGLKWDAVDLWLAQWLYTPDPNKNPSTPNGRTSPWTLWQYTDKGHGPTYGTKRPEALDLDVFNGTVEQMKAKYKVAGEIPPPTGDSNMKYQGTVLTGLNVRSSYPSGTVLMSMPSGTKVEADRIESGWWHLTKRGDVAVTREEWSYQGDTNGYIRLDATIPDEPEPTEPDTWEIYKNGVLKHRIVGTSEDF